MMKQSIQRNYWCLRQNDGENMDQTSMYDFIIDTGVVFCPWGLSGICKQNVTEQLYNETFDLSPEKLSKSQDRKFVTDMNIGDIVLIPFLQTNRCIVGRISSNVIYDVDTNYSILYSSSGKKLIKYYSDELEQCKPIGRFIEIIDPNYIIQDKRCLGRLSLCKPKYVQLNFAM
jgi:hypothetical protein